MTEDEYRERIEASENRINDELEAWKRAFLCTLQAENSTFIRLPQLATYFREYEERVEAAKAQMAREASEIELEFYRGQGFDL